MDLAQLRNRDLGVNLRRVEPLVSEQLLDEADFGPVLQHVGRARVPQQVARADARHARGNQRAGSLADDAHAAAGARRASLPTLSRRSVGEGGPVPP